MNIRCFLFLLLTSVVCNVHAQLIKVHGMVMTPEGEPIELAVFMLQEVLPGQCQI